jgi:hypothetical protein
MGRGLWVVVVWPVAATWLFNQMGKAHHNFGDRQHRRYNRTTSENALAYGCLTTPPAEL